MSIDLVHLRSLLITDQLNKPSFCEKNADLRQINPDKENTSARQI